jgi:hypothetical protein
VQVIAFVLTIRRRSSVPPHFIKTAGSLFSLSAVAAHMRLHRNRLTWRRVAALRELPRRTTGHIMQWQRQRHDAQTAGLVPQKGSLVLNPLNEGLRRI